MTVPPTPPVELSRSRHGPFERIHLSSPLGRHAAALSVYRVGDLLIDTGGTRVAAALAEALRDHPPRRIVCTHQHEDHAGAATSLRRAFGAIPVHVPAAHVALLRSFDRVPPYRASHWGNPEPIPDAIGFEEGAVFESGGVALEAVPTPGHTPGHMALVARVGGEQLALTGDLYTGPRPLAAFFESAADDLVRSCRLLAARGPGLRMLPTHGRVRWDGAVAVAEVADLVERHAEAVLAASHRLGTREPSAVARQVFGAEGEMAGASGGEFSFAAFVRSVLDPVRALPATPVRLA